MAFLCPVRIGRKKRRAPGDLGHPAPGRITGSASIETLVRVGLEKENMVGPAAAGALDTADGRKMVVLHDFVPCVDDELEVKRGQIVTMLYRENDWVYVVTEPGSGPTGEGFMPHSYCTPLSSTSNQVSKKQPNRAIEPPTDDNQSLTAFHKESLGHHLVLYNFVARDENDLSVERGEIVTLLNQDDPEWYWVVRSDSQEGFVPSAFMVAQAEATNLLMPSGATTKSASDDLDNAVDTRTMTDVGEESTLNSATGRLFHGGTELVMLYDYKAQAPDDLSVRRGDWVYVDLGNQTVDGWLWAYAPKLRKWGFIPKAYARPPAMTVSL
ncbi:hypothetical protein HDE_06029 [Halotydeus destructor]|nr:hypothetical protein HDE_06029 [Halotydeus destructor]